LFEAVGWYLEKRDQTHEMEMGRDGKSDPKRNKTPDALKEVWNV
jgi:hypothetical protein